MTKLQANMQLALPSLVRKIVEVMTKYGTCQDFSRIIQAS